MPQWPAVKVSVIVDMPTKSPPKVLIALISDGDSKNGPTVKK